MNLLEWELVVGGPSQNGSFVHGVVGVPFK